MINLGIRRKENIGHEAGGDLASKSRSGDLVIREILYEYVLVISSYFVSQSTRQGVLCE